MFPEVNDPPANARFVVGNDGRVTEIEDDANVRIDGTTTKKTLTSLSLAGVLCSSATLLLGQNAPAFLWVRQGNGTSGFGKGIFTDTNGFSYVTGYFDGTNAFGTNHLASYGANDIFVAKYDATGNMLWARHAGTTNGEEGLGICADSSGNCFVTGWYNSAMAIFGSVSLPTFGFQDIFVAKYDASGNLQWAKRAGASGLDNGLGIATDGAGNCYVTGVYNGNANFSGTSLTNAGANDIFVAKYNGAGNLLWVRRAGGSSGDVGSGIGVDDSGNCYVAGGFSSSVAGFDGLMVTNAGGTDIFLAKYDTSGTVQWVWSGGGPGNESPRAGTRVAVDAAGNSYVHGAFGGTATFGTNLLTSAGSNDVFVAKFDNAGNLLWIRQGGGPGDENDFGGAVALDPNGNCYVAGSYLLNADFGGVTLTNAGDHDIFMTKYDRNGALQYVQRAGGTNYDYCRGVSVDRNGNCYLTGRFFGDADFGGLKLTSPDNDMFVAKLAAFNPTNELRLVSHFANGVASLLIFALPGQSAAIEAAADLTEPALWTTLTNFTLPVSPALWLDENSANRPRRFYRARLDP